MLVWGNWLLNCPYTKTETCSIWSHKELPKENVLKKANCLLPCKTMELTSLSTKKETINFEDSSTGPYSLLAVVLGTLFGIWKHLLSIKNLTETAFILCPDGVFCFHFVCKQKDYWLSNNKTKTSFAAFKKIMSVCLFLKSINDEHHEN